ncbi:MAG: ABC transporter permease [Spirochaetales bacterium]|nr:ABC transporter permease [Spirochaetales bacterium]
MKIPETIYTVSWSIDRGYPPSFVGGFSPSRICAGLYDRPVRETRFYFDRRNEGYGDENRQAAHRYNNTRRFEETGRPRSCVIRKTGQWSFSEISGSGGVKVGRYCISRLLVVLTTLLGVTLLGFGLTRLLPGSPVEQAVLRMSGGSGETAPISGDNGETERLRRMYGFDKPFAAQYAAWVADIVRGRFGDSLRTNKPVLAEIASRIPVSLAPALTGFFLALLVGIPLGLKKAIRRNSIFDGVSDIAVYIGYAVPGFILGILFIVLSGDGTLSKMLLPGGISSGAFEYTPAHVRIADVVRRMAMPVVCYAISGLAVLAASMKTALIREFRREYMTTALSKGLPLKKVIFRHALRNAIIPVLAGIGSFFNLFFASSIFIEKVFEIKGMGMLFFDSIVGRDYPVVLGLILIHAIVNITGRLVSQLLLVLADPGIRVTGSM